MGRLMAAAAAAACASHACGYQILNNTDFPGYNLPGFPYGQGTSIDDCAKQCLAMDTCLAVSWNGPSSQIHDNSCNFKCSSKHSTSDSGETAAIVRAGVADTCKLPPSPPGPPAAADWAARYAAGQLVYSRDVVELMPFVGNGYVATHPIHPSMSGILYISGVFNGVAVPFKCEKDCSAPHRATIPSYRVAVSGTSVPEQGGYALDFERAEFVSRTSVGSVSVESRYYAHLTRMHLLVHEMTLNNSGGATTVQLSATEGDTGGDIDFTVKTEGGVYSAAGETRLAETPKMGKIGVAVAANTPPSSVSLAAGEVKTLYFITAAASTLDSSDPKAAAQSALSAGVAAEATLLAEHRAGWATRWQQGRLEVRGDLQLAQAVNASMYFLLSSIRGDWPQGLSPGGLASDGYDGHSFWDCETWMWPNLLLLQPDAAKSALQYRVDRMEGAAAKAASNGYAGLMFPWESAASGYEAQGSPNGQVGPWGKYEQHITADVGFAASQFWQATRDADFMKSSLEPLLRGIADFWASRVRKGSDGLYHIDDVMCPDEYHSGVDDSVYTNYVASLSLLAAVEAAKAVGKPAGANWTDVAKNMYIPFDAAKQYHPEYAGYTQGTGIKQADAILLAFPFLLNMSAAVRANDLTVYAAVTDPNGPAMTWAMFAVGWLEAGDLGKAESNFKRGYANVQEPFKVWTETPDGGAVNFITGAGGFLQSVLYGYGGLRLRDDRLDIAPPAPPQNATALRLNGVHYRGSRLEVGITAQTMEITVTDQTQGATALTLVSKDGKKTPLTPGRLVSVPRAASYSVTPSQ